MLSWAVLLITVVAKNIVSVGLHGWAPRCEYSDGKPSGVIVFRLFFLEYLRSNVQHDYQWQELSECYPSYFGIWIETKK